MAPGVPTRRAKGFSEPKEPPPRLVAPPRPEAARRTRAGIGRGFFEAGASLEVAPEWPLPLGAAGAFFAPDFLSDFVRPFDAPVDSARALAFVEAAFFTDFFGVGRDFAGAFFEGALFEDFFEAVLDAFFLVVFLAMVLPADQSARSKARLHDHLSPPHRARLQRMWPSGPLQPAARRARAQFEPGGVGGGEAAAMSSSSTSKISVARGGMTGGRPCSP